MALLCKHFYVSNYALFYYNVFRHIAGRYENEERYAGNTEMSPVTIAQQIVNEFRENMEQSELGGLSGGFEATEGASEAAAAGGDVEAGAGKYRV